MRAKDISVMSRACPSGPAVVAPAATSISRTLDALRRPADRTVRPVEAEASRAGLDFLDQLGVLVFPRPGEAHRTFYRVTPRRIEATSESRSRSVSSLSLRSRCLQGARCWMPLYAGPVARLRC